MKSIRPVASYSRISKLSGGLPAAKHAALHSILKIRLGHTPVVDVKMPAPAGWSVRKSSQYGAIRLFIPAVGRQALVNAVLLLVNWRLPFELRLAVVNGAP